MNRELATQEAKKFLFDTDLMKPETRALILRDLLISSCELEAAKVRLREAEWWSEFGCIKEFHELVMNSKDFEENRLSACEHCERLAQLRAATKGEKG